MDILEGRWPWRVLVVEDDPTNRALLKAIVEPEVVTVETASDGFDALRSIEQNPPHLMITDLQMPRLDGLSLLRELRLRGHHFPVAILSIHHDDGIPDLTRALGAAEFLAKPVRAAEVKALLERLAQTLGVRRTG